MAMSRVVFVEDEMINNHMHHMYNMSRFFFFLMDFALILCYQCNLTSNCSFRTGLWLPLVDDWFIIISNVNTHFIV